MLKFIKGKKFRIIAIVVAVVVVISAAVGWFVIDCYTVVYSSVTARFRVLEDGETFYISEFYEHTFSRDLDVEDRLFSMLSGFTWYSPLYSPYTPNSSDTYRSIYGPYTRFIIHITEDTRISFGDSERFQRALNVTLEEGQTLEEILTDRKLVVSYVYGRIPFGRKYLVSDRRGPLPFLVTREAARIIVLDE